MSTALHRLIVGTTSRHKAHEIADLLEPCRLKIATLIDFANAIDVVEDGDSFAANARLKATQQAQHLGEWVLADDSGLEVDALGGAPGIYSARYAGTGRDADNNAKLLTDLAGVPWEKRGARYVCYVVLSDPTGAVRAEAFGECRGWIRSEPSGMNGFGYDPLFEIREYHLTFGELGPSVKAVLSHRARAIRGLIPHLKIFRSM